MHFLFISLLLLLPLSVIPGFIPSEIVQWAFLSLLALGILVFWIIRSLTTKKITIIWSPEAGGLGFLTIASFLSFTFTSQTKIAALMDPFGITTMVALCILLLFGETLLSKKDKILLRLGCGVEAVILALLAIYQGLGVPQMLFPTVSILHNFLWTPVGTTTTLLSIFCIMLPLLCAITWHAIKAQKDGITALALTGCILLIIAIGITLVRFIPTIASTMLPLPIGGMLMIRAWDTPLHMFFGSGIEQGFIVFTKYRPQTLNTTPLWSTAFSMNASTFLHIGMTQGLVGLVAFFIYIGSMIQSFRTHHITLIQVLCIIGALCFFPPSLSLTLFIILLIISMPNHTNIQHTASPSLLITVTIFLSALILGASYGLYHIIQGEYAYTQARNASIRGNGSQTHTFLTKAIAHNPMIATYHIAMSQTYLSLSEGLLQNIPLEKNNTTPKLSEEDKTMLTTFVTNAIKEAKIGVTLAPDNVNTWANLAHIYQKLIGIAKDADMWALASYEKAIMLDPTNPVLHLDLGGLYRTLGKEEEAGQQFIQSITLKPNYINGFYNLADVFKKKGDYDNAIKTLEQTKQLTAKGSNEEQTLEIEIISLTKEKNTSRTPKQASPSSLIAPTLLLPENK